MANLIWCYFGLLLVAVYTAYDLGDPWQSNACVQWGCCSQSKSYNATTCAANQDGGKCGDACLAMTNTSYYMGPIHPRIKKPVGERLALAAMGVAFDGKKPYAGPTISGCTYGGAKTLTVEYNSTLLRGGAVGVKPYDGKSSFSAFRVLTDASYWCDKVRTPLTPLGLSMTDAVHAAKRLCCRPVGVVCETAL